MACDIAYSGRMAWGFSGERERERERRERERESVKFLITLQFLALYIGLAPD